MTTNAAAVLLGERDPQRTALVCGVERLTYAALRDAVARAASAWRWRGLEQGERVAIKLPDGCAWVSAFLGTIWAGGVAVAVNPRIRSEDWQFIVGEAGFRFILAESPEDTPPQFRDRVVTPAQWVRGVTSAAPIEPAAMDEEAPAFWSHSSGTSGRPKAVVHAQRFALHVERVAAELLGVRAEDRLYASSKLFFSYPLGNSLFSGLKLGATVILDPQWPTAGSVAATIAEQRPSLLFSVPSLYRSLLKEGLARGLARFGIRACVSAGEALPSSLRDEWRKETGMTIVDGYGASETLSLVLLDRGEGEGLRPVPGVEVQGASPCGDGAPTPIRIKAPTLALGYWNRPDADAAYFRDGAFCPTDLFERTGAGAWRFSGRDDSMVKISGRWVNLVELEERLAGSCPGIIEAAAVAVPDSDGVAAVAFFYALRSEAPADTGVALKACADGLPPYQRPRWLRVVPSLPRTATGKLLRRKLQDLHAAHG
ncbi:MAG: AMP-binding protein [Betaproteobacteria bacterium]|nr:AMP-binding protein [Betaproteobacteria bacterium]